MNSDENSCFFFCLISVSLYCMVNSLFARFISLHHSDLLLYDHPLYIVIHRFFPSLWRCYYVNSVSNARYKGRFDIVPCLRISSARGGSLLVRNCIFFISVQILSYKGTWTLLYLSVHNVLVLK